MEIRCRLLSLPALLAVFLLASLLWAAPVLALTISVKNAANGQAVSGFRWLVEEDNTLQTPPQVRVNPSISTAIHMSHAPAIATGEENGTSATVNIPAFYAGKPLMVSVVPFAGYQMSGHPVDVGQSSIEIKVNPLPIPTAQISVLVFNDNQPINNVPDAGEPGLAGFKVLLDDTRGQVSQDVFGNPLGTTYQMDGNGQPVMVDGAPVVQTQGLGYVLTGPDGQALVKYLAAGKYGVRISVPTSQPGWIQTATIEGTKTIDAWAKPNEPQLFVEGFGTGFNHVFFGFVNPGQLPWGAGTPGALGQIPPASQATLTGLIVSNHFGPPPVLQQFNKGIPVEKAYVCLNDSATRQGLIAVPVDGNGRYTISGVPAGTYLLSVFDEPLLTLYYQTEIIVHPGTNVVGPPNPTTGNPPPATASLDHLIPRWFGSLVGKVFYDTNQNGFPDPGEVGIPRQTVNIRYRDGSMYQTLVTAADGTYDFAEVFPFFKWLVVEVDYGRFKPTGMTTVVDAGGPIPVTNPAWLADGRRNPQIQPDSLPYRTETGPVLLEAMHLFLGQDNRIDWGKVAYGPDETGGISGIVWYGATRAANDPRLEAPEFLDTGTPRAQVNLYLDANNDKIIDDLNGDGHVTLADVDNYPFGWRDGGAKGPEDIDRNGNGVFDPGDAVQIAWTDSFDDNQPTGSVWTGRTIPIINGVQVNPNMDNFATWNQVRPGVFDGGYAFSEYYPMGLAKAGANATAVPLAAPMSYIVEANPAYAGYMVQKEEDKNVDFGESYIPSTLAEPAECVGDAHLVPPYLSFNTVGGLGLQALPGVANSELVAGVYANQTRPLCDRKWVRLQAGLNAAADFNYFTMVPKAARAMGFALNDLGAEFDKTSPIYGEKPAAPWIPVSFTDWTGNEVARVYADEFGTYNAMLPSNYTTNLPTPLGQGYNILTINLNHPFKTNPDGSTSPDPFYNPHYGQMHWNFMYSAGKTSYSDTPILPVGAFVGPPDYTVDAFPADHTPRVALVSGPNNSGPLLRTDLDTLTITSMGSVAVPNPEYSSQSPATPKTIIRDYGFGSGGSVTVGGVALQVLTWTSGQIQVQAPSGSISGGSLKTGQLVVTRNDYQRSSEMAVTVHVVPTGSPTVIKYVDGNANQTIQSVIDDPTTTDGSLVFVKPKTGQYNEAVIVYKNLRLQGYGGESTKIYSAPQPLDQLQVWHTKVQSLIASGDMKNLGGLLVFRPIERPGFLCLTNATRITTATVDNRRIDGFYIYGSLAGGGINVPDLGNKLTLSNNWITGNQGARGGGIVLGTIEGAALCPDITIRHNFVTSNSVTQQGGGGISIFNGTDRYRIEQNRLAANFSIWNGGAICHYGTSNRGLIRGNTIVMNEVFFGNQVGGKGGGIYISAEPIVGGGLTDGAGSVTIDRNLIQGNMAGADSGGGIAVENYNGSDASGFAYDLRILSNIIVNNVATFRAGGIDLKDVVRCEIVHNTITQNDSTASSKSAFAANTTQSVPQIAGLVVEANGAPLATASGRTFADVLLVNNVLLNNRSHYMDTNPALNGGSGALVYVGINDLGVVGTVGQLRPQTCVLTNPAPYPGNLAPTLPGFVQTYFNALTFGVIIDEAGNNVLARYTPLTPYVGNYHLGAASSMRNQGTYLSRLTFPELAYDIDGQSRPVAAPDIGADQYSASSQAACLGDFDGNRRIDLSDLRIFRSQVGCTGGCLADLNGDGVVDAADLAILRPLLGTTCP